MGKKKTKKLEVPQWTLGDRMRKARETRAIGVGEMAGIMMRNRNTINNYESDKTRPPRPVLDRWAEVTGTPLDWIIGDASPFGWRNVPEPPRGRRPKSAWTTADELRRQPVAA